MADRRDRDPELGRVEDVDDTASGRPALGGKPGAGAGEEPPLTAGLSTRDQPEGVSDGVGVSVDDMDDADAQPGRGLRVAREGAGLEIAELSRRTHLGRALLEDLEANRFEHITPAYVRGYLRSCARELGVDAEPWVQAYDRRAPAEPAPRPVATRKHRANRRRAVWPYWVGALLVVVLLAVATVFWAEDVSLDALPEFGTGDGLPTLETETTPDEPAGQEPAEGRPQDEPGAATEGDTAPDTETGTVEAETPAIGPPEPLARPERDPAAEEASEDTAADTGMDTVPEDAGIDEPVAPAPVDEAGAAGEETEVVEVPEEITEGTTGEAESAPSADGRAELILEIRETSWVEIRDADGAVVLTGVLSPGTREQLQLELPGRAVLGNAAGVDLTLNGEPVAFDEHVRDDRTARFDLEE
ncbi:cytoskeleton protein RodZ [Thioalkalivibrio sp. ALE21]|uniref:helix-turn-helix domain-containing protein n=1 Tax=Thioalkalivibrio sp. ALE21 TaxID=1158175 RepID=UPI000D8C73EC|nr:helix-turn-helix domain-containing protein [Thioalkalivibrio sp. ALE21]PYG00772.1 cytoskeleton protein RodZ [Thioalkalivibrio sp. ALE21]